MGAFKEVILGAQGCDIGAQECDKLCSEISDIGCPEISDIGALK
jgi:hypothetical protein